MALELSTLSVEELVELQKQIAKEFKAREASIYKNAKAEINEVAKKYGLSIEEILNAKGSKASSKKSVAPKYRNPQNPEQTWTGRGIKPTWLKSALEAGQSLEAFLI